MARAVERVAPRAAPDVGAQRSERLEVAEAREEVVVEVGQDLLAQLLELDREVRRLAGQVRLAVVVGERDVELVASPTLSPTRFASKPGIRRSWPMMSGIRSAAPPSNGSPSRVPMKPMTA